MYEYDEDAKKAAYKMYEYDPEAKKMFGYVCFYKGKRIEVRALRSFDAQEIAAKIFRVKAKKSHEVSVYLAEKPTGEPVIHSTAEF